MRDLRIGIDVGGTNTDAVLLDDAGGVVSKTKVPTTQDPSEAITSALTAVLPAETERVARVVLGTTHAVNAILERRGLRRVAVVRIGAPATRSVRPLFGWPEDLRSAVSAGEAVVRGGVEIDGRDVVPLDADEVAAFLRGVGAGAEAVAITGVFSPLDPRQELAVAQLAAEALGPVPVSLGHRIGSLGLLERENATVLNAALGSVIGQVVSGLQVAMADHRLACPAFLAQNDGTPMAVGLARELPVLTIGSGPANSVRGAAALSRLDEAIVVDVGGTSTDVGVLARGFPRESTAGVEMGGVRTNFRMPDLVSIALGGGSIVGSDGSPGPRSVGAALTTDALVFGGETPTLTMTLKDAATGAVIDPATIVEPANSAAVAANEWRRANLFVSGPRDHTLPVLTTAAEHADPTHSYANNDFRVQTDLADEDSRITRTATSIVYQLADVAGLEPGTYSDLQGAEWDDAIVEEAHRFVRESGGFNLDASSL